MSEQVGHDGTENSDEAQKQPEQGRAESPVMRSMPSMGVAGRHHLAAHPVSRKSFLKLFVFLVLIIFVRIKTAFKIH